MGAYGGYVGIVEKRMETSNLLRIYLGLVGNMGICYRDYTGTNNQVEGVGLDVGLYGSYLGCICSVLCRVPVGR